MGRRLKVSGAWEIRPGDSQAARPILAPTMWSLLQARSWGHQDKHSAVPDVRSLVHPLVGQLVGPPTHLFVHLLAPTCTRLFAER